MKNYLRRLSYFLILGLLTTTAIAASNRVNNTRVTQQQSGENCRVVQHTMGETCIPRNPQRVVSLSEDFYINALELVVGSIATVYVPNFPFPNYLRGKVEQIESVGIVGATGSGKSTLVKLLLRFYKVQKGNITIDGINISNLNLYDLRRAIAWVSQDVFLFHGTVAENIRYGSFDSTRAQIIDAAKLAEAHEFIEKLPQGYDTIVGERGQKLSGGQRQRKRDRSCHSKKPTDFDSR